MRVALVGALAACALAACRYDYEALMGNGSAGGGGSHVPAGAAGDDGAAGTGGGAGGRGGDGAGGSVALGGRGGQAGNGVSGRGGGGGEAQGEAGRGGSGGVGGGAGGAAGRGGAGGRGGTGGLGGETGRGGTGGGGAGGGAGRGGAGGAAGSVGGAGAGGGAAGVTGGGGGAAGAGGGAGGATGSGGAGGGPDGDLVLWYKFDDASGAVALDSSALAGAPRNGMLTTAGSGGGVAFSTNHQVGTHAVSLTANVATGGGYVIMPGLHDLAPGALTISVWVNVTTAQFWQRVFDVGNSTTNNLALTTHNGSNAVRFVIRNGTLTQEIISAVTLSLSAWHHLVVVLPEGSPYTGSLYVDGVSVATNTAMTLHAADLGATANNFIGRSQFSADPFFSGLIDDFRVYRRALTREQIAALYAAR